MLIADLAPGGTGVSPVIAVHLAVIAFDPLKRLPRCVNEKNMASDFFTSVIARIYILATNEGGREFPFKTGYRLPFCIGRFRSSCTVFGVTPDTVVNETLALGAEYDVQLLVATMPPNLAIGLKFQLCDGPKVVAHGEVLEILEPNTELFAAFTSK